MSQITIRGYDGDWQVWIALRGGNPIRMSESFVIGGGSTRWEAIADAVKDLETCINKLKAESVGV